MVFFVTGHVRMECPPPQSGNTGEKGGPCDVNVIDSMFEEDEDNDSIPAYPLIPGALNTVTWLESIPHPGAPVRFALSRDVGADTSENNEEDDFFGSTSTMDVDEYAELFTASFESCLLLDHVPHDAHSQPNYRDASSWHRSSITLWIPDIKCERCHLQLISIMSDEMHGVPKNTKCSYKNKIGVDSNNDNNITDNSEEQEQEQYPDCPAVYHSCSPVSINGTVPRNEIEHCNTTDFEEKLGWPFTPRSEIGFNTDHDGDDLVSYDHNDDNDLVYEYSTYWNRGDVGLFSDSEARLLKAGAPLTECDSPQYCDPNEYFETIFVVPETAAYTAMEGSCAAITGMEVAPFQSGGILPSVPKRQKQQAVQVVTTDAGNGTVPDSTTSGSTSGSSGTNPTNDTTITDGEEKLVTDEKSAAVIVADKNDVLPSSSNSNSSSSNAKNSRSMMMGWVVVAGIFSFMKL